MFGNAFYHGSARKLIVAFGSVFNNLHVQREQQDGTIKDIKVPLIYESQKKYMAQLTKDPTNRQVPRAGFIMNGMTMDLGRGQNQMNQWRSQADDGLSAQVMYAPVPYNYSFTLDIYVDYMDDGLQIIEQILPYFQPEFNIVVEDVPELNIKRDVPIQLESVEMVDSFEGDFGEFRIVNWQLNFTVQGFIYPPLSDQKVIKKVITNYSFNSNPGYDVPISEQIDFAINPWDANEDDDYTIDKTRTKIGDWT
jgi:hypothetical protein